MAEPLSLKPSNSSGLKCIIDETTFGIVQMLCASEAKTIHPYQIFCLSYLLEAVTLYDEIIVYNQKPNPFTMYPKDKDMHNTRYDLFYHTLFGPLGKTLEDIECLKTYDPYDEEFSIAEQVDIFADSYKDTSLQYIDGSIHGTGLMSCPNYILSKNEQIVNNPNLERTKKGTVVNAQ